MRKMRLPALAVLVVAGLLGALLSGCGDGRGLLPSPTQGYPNAGGQYPSASGQYPGSPNDYPGTGGSSSFDLAAAARKICDRLVACGSPVEFAEICIKMITKEAKPLKDLPQANEIVNCLLALPCTTLTSEEGPEKATKQCARKYGAKIDDTGKPPKPEPDMFVPPPSPDAG